MTPGEVVTGLGYFTGAAVLVLAARSQGRATEGMAWVAAIGFLAAIVGAKLTQTVISGAPLLAALDPRTSGKSLLGGLLIGWLAVELTKRRLGIRSSTGDMFALALPAGEAVGRLGCFLNGCCYGAEYAGPWAVMQHGALRHPAQLYSAAVSLGLFGLLLWARRRTVVEGELFRFYLIGFGITRFGLEYLRWRETTYGGLSLMQWSCLEITVYGVLWVLWKRRPAKPMAGVV